MDKIYDEVAHDLEILSLTYSPEIDGQCCTAYMYAIKMAVSMCNPFHRSSVSGVCE